MTTSALRVAATAAVLLSLSACDSATPPEPVMNHVPLARTATNLVEEGREDDWEGGAFVLNSGEGKPDAFCFFQGNAFFTNQVTLVRSPSSRHCWIGDAASSAIRRRRRIKAHGCAFRPARRTWSATSVTNRSRTRRCNLVA